ncbi:hypothetical protein MKD33_05205, partial [Chromobacterium piscinae]
MPGMDAARIAGLLD